MIGNVILVEYRASKAWRKGDTWYFQSQSFSAGHSIDYYILAVFKLLGEEIRYIKALVDAQNVSYIRLAIGKNGTRALIHISCGKHIVEAFFNKTTVVDVKVDGKSIKIEFEAWDFKGYEISITSHSNQKHVLIIKFFKVYP